MNAAYCVHEGCVGRPVRDTSLCERHQLRVDKGPSPRSLDETLTFYFYVVDALGVGKARGRLDRPRRARRGRS